MNYGINHFSEHPFRTSEQTVGLSEHLNLDSCPLSIVGLRPFNLRTNRRLLRTSELQNVQQLKAHSSLQHLKP